MNWLDSILRRLPQSRELASQLDESNDARTLAEDRLSAKESECEWLRQELEKARSEALNAVKTLANAGWQQRYGWRIYPEAPGIPETAHHESPPGPMTSPESIRREQLKRKAEQFREQGTQFWEQTRKS